jgi:hypothetical protein
MLSPNAMNRVAASTGTGGTYGTRVTLKPHAAVRTGVLESVAVQETPVAPSGKALPEIGLQTDVTGANPPTAAGADHWTACVGVFTSATLTSPGQFNDNGATGSTAGPEGLLGE